MLTFFRNHRNQVHYKGTLENYIILGPLISVRFYKENLKYHQQFLPALKFVFCLF
jgi:hypothetical protein